LRLEIDLDLENSETQKLEGDRLMSSTSSMLVELISDPGTALAISSLFVTVLTTALWLTCGSREESPGAEANKDAINFTALCHKRRSIFPKDFTGEEVPDEVRREP